MRPKLYHMGIRGKISRSTLADANEKRDWRIFAEFAQVLIAEAKTLYAGEDFGVEIDSTVYALDSTTIDLCLSLFPWARFRKTKAAVKLHTLLDLRGSIPEFIHITDGKLHDVNVLDLLIPAPGAFYIMDRGYIDFERLYRIHEAGAFFVTRGKRTFNAGGRYSRAVDKTTGLRSDQTVVLTVLACVKVYPAPSGSSLSRPRNEKALCLCDQQHDLAGADHRRVVQSALAGGTVFQMDQAAPADQGVLRNLGKRRQDADLDRRVRLRAGGDHQKASAAPCQPLHDSYRF